MSNFISLKGFTPKVGEGSWMADTARIVGDVETGSKCSFWFGSVIRGDVSSIRLGDRVNVQDNAVIHATFNKSVTSIGNDVSIGHGAMVHGCTIEDEVLVGMNAIIMDNALIKKHVIIAAGAVVLENTICESGWIYGGIPAKPIKKLEGDNLQFFITRTAANYIKYSSWYTQDNANENS